MTALETEVDDISEAELDAAYSVITELEHPDIEGLSLAFREPPVAPAKLPRKQKVVLAWEEFLDFLVPTPGRSVQVFEFTGEEAKAKAYARKRSMHSRLLKTRINQIWEITAAVDRDDDGRPLTNWGVYAQFVRPATPAEVADRNQKHLDAVERGKHAAAARQR